MRLAGRRPGLAVFAALLAAGLVVGAANQGMHGLSYRAVVASLQAMPARALAAAVLATAIGYAVLVANDLSALCYARAAPPLATTVFASFCGYALGNFIGLGALSGGAARYRIYAAAGLSGPTIARVTVFIAAAFGIGAAETIALGLAFRAHAVAQLCALPCGPLRAAAAAVLGLTIVVLFACRGERRSLRLGRLNVELPGSRLLLAQIAVTTADIAAAALALWVLLPPTAIDFPTFVTIYAAALWLGVISHAPGGLGVFDAALIYTIGSGHSSNAVAAALVAYRAIYFVVPFALAAVLLTGAEIRRSLARCR